MNTDTQKMVWTELEALAEEDYRRFQSALLPSNALPLFTHKAIQKIRESRLISLEMREKLLPLRRTE